MGYNMMSYFVGKIPARNSIWIISDEFGNNSFEEYFKQRQLENNGNDNYMNENFEVTGYVTSRFGSNPSGIGRLRNSLVHAITKQVLLPKYVVLVPDNNIIKMLNHYRFGMSTALGRLIDYLMSEFDKIVKAQNEYLPTKSKQEGKFPHFIWIHAPLHDNFTDNYERGKFNKCLVTMAKLHQNTSTLELKKVWDPCNSNLFIKEARRFTSQGYTAYWDAVDKAVKYADTILMKKLERQNKDRNDSFKKGLGLPKQVSLYVINWFWSN